MGQEPLRRVDLSRLYEVIKWHSKPDDPIARERFNNIVGFVEKIVSQEPLASMILKDRVKILDVMAGSGIAGVAFAKVIASKGVGVDLLVTDAREDELGLVYQWASIAGVSGDNVRISYAKADATRLPEELGPRGFDLVVCWGSSLPHFDVYSFILFLAGAREVQTTDGILIMEQADILPPILVNNAFRRILVEGEALTIYKEYDPVRGVQRRLAYKLPELEYIGVTESRLWDMSQIEAMTWLFYNNIKYT